VYFLSRQSEETPEMALHTKELEDLEKQFSIPSLKLQQLLSVPPPPPSCLFGRCGGWHLERDREKRITGTRGRFGNGR